MKRKYAAIVLSMAMVFSPVSAFAADNTADAEAVTEADAANDEGTTEVSEYIIGQVTKVSDTSIEVKTGEVLKEAKEEKTEEAKDGEKAEEKAEDVSVQLKEDTQSYDITEDTPLYLATGHNKLEVLEAGKEADDAAADANSDEADKEAADSEKKSDDADTTEADTEEGSDDTETADTDKEGEAVKESETTEAEVEKNAEEKDNVYNMVVGTDAKISTVKVSDVKEGDMIILELDQDGNVVSATVLETDDTEAAEENDGEASDSSDAADSEKKEDTVAEEDTENADGGSADTEEAAN